MKEIWKRIEKDIRSFWQIGAAIVIYDIVVQLLFGEFCPAVIVTGLPCPGCGMTRAVLYFVTGRFSDGLSMNLLGICWIFLAVYFCLMRYVLGRKPVGVLQVGGCLVVLMICFYIYRMWFVFPGESPMCYTEGNLLERTRVGYREGVLELIAVLQRTAQNLLTFGMR